MKHPYHSRTHDCKPAEISPSAPRFTNSLRKHLPHLRAQLWLHRRKWSDHLRALALTTCALTCARSPKSAQVRASARKWFDHLRARTPLVSAQVAQVFSLIFSCKKVLCLGKPGGMTVGDNEIATGGK